MISENQTNRRLLQRPSGLRTPGTARRVGASVLLWLAAATASEAQQNAAPLPDRSTRTRYASAAALQDQRLFDLAAAEWQALIDAAGDDSLTPRARYNLGICRFQQGDFAAAEQAFAAIADPTVHAELAESALLNLGLTRFNAAQGHLSAGQTERYQQTLQNSIAAFDRQLAAFSSGKQAADARYFRAEALAQRGDLVTAATAYQLFLKKHADSPRVAAARMGLGTALAATEQHELAAAILTELIDSPNADPMLVAEARHRRGEARLRLKRYEPAAADFAQAAQQDGFRAADEAKFREAFCIFQAGDALRSAALYDELVNSWPDSPLVREARFDAAKALFAAGRFAEATTRFEELFTNADVAANAEAAHWFARSAISAGQQLRPASSAIDAALAATPPNDWLVELQIDRGDLLAATNGPESAAEVYESAARQFSKQPAGQRAAVLAGRAWLEVADNERAAAIAKLTLKQNPPPELRVELLQIAAQASAADDSSRAAARDYYRRLLKEFTDDPRRAAWELRLAELLIAGQQSDEGFALLEGLPARLTREDSLAALRLHAAALTEQGRSAEAIEKLSAAIDQAEQSPRLAELLYQRGRLLDATGRPGDALADYQRLLLEFPQSATAPFARAALGANRFAAGDYNACVELLQPFQSVEADAGQPASGARFTLASALQQLERYEEALTLLPGAEAPAAEKLLLRGICQARLNRLDDAQQTLEECLALEEPAGVADRVLYELAWVQHGDNFRAKADLYFRQLAEDHPESPLAAEANFRLGESLFSKQKFAAATRRFEKGAASPEVSPELREQMLHRLGWSRFKNDEHAAAAKAFESQLAARPDGGLAVDARLMLGECWFALAKFKQALVDYQAAFASEQLAAADADLLRLAKLHAGQAAGSLGDWQRALELLTRPAQQSAGPLANQFAYEQAWALQKLGRNTEARPLLEKVAAADQSVLSARARFVLGELQFAAKEHEQAVRTFFQVVYGYGGAEAPSEYHTWQVQAMFEAARCLEIIGRVAPAGKLYAELIERFPATEKAELARESLRRLSSR